MKIYRYAVRGQGAFPIDMLRYDSCWPRSQDDVESIVGSGPDAIRYTVGVSSIREPTVDRWSSFGWTVYNVEKITV